MRNYMNKSVYLLIVLLVGFLFSSLSLAQEVNNQALNNQDISIQVAQDTLHIPVPNGFTKLTTNMEPFYDIKEKMVAPTNADLVDFISNQDASVASVGQIPKIQRSFSVQVAKKLEGLHVTGIQFAALKALIRDKNEQIMASAKSVINQNLADQTKAINHKMNTNVHLNVTSTKVLPVHDDTPNSLSYSMYVYANVGFGSDPKLDSVKNVSIVTVNFVYIHHQVFFFYVSGNQDDLDWTRQASKLWIEKALKDNS